MSSDLPNHLAKAKRAGVISQLRRTKPSLAIGYCISPDNQMAKGSSAYLSNISVPNPGVVTARTYPDEIGEYIATSSIYHCYDAHAYLAAAWDTMLQGNASAAVHLAYYSELRSVMGLLACDGIGVLNDEHFVVDGSGNAIVIKGEGRTHSFCWQAFKWWSLHGHTGIFLEEVIVGGTSIADWLLSFPSGATLNSERLGYLKSIGLDISRLSDGDMIQRGRASYRPTAFEGHPTRQVRGDLRLLKDIGEHFIGSNGPRDGSLGGLILCAILRRAFHTKHDKSPQEHYDVFEKEVQDLLAIICPDAPTERVLARYCLRNPLPIIPVLSDALDQENGDLDGVLSRATLLCYHSVLYTRRLLNEAGICEDDLRFWWQPALEARGAVSARTQLSSQDVAQDSLDAHNDFLSIPSGGDRRSLWEQHSSAMANACRCERIAIAGLFA